MGSEDGETDEKPVHTVTVSDFYLSKYELTVAEFKAFVDGNVWTFPNRLDVKSQLRGKNLACWCKPGACCHADVLLEIANK